MGVYDAQAMIRVYAVSLLAINVDNAVHVDST